MERYTLGQVVSAILANAYLIACPVLIFTGTLGYVNYLPGCGLAACWVAALMIALCAGTPSQPASASC